MTAGNNQDGDNTVMRADTVSDMKQVEVESDMTSCDRGGNS